MALVWPGSREVPPLPLVGMGWRMEAPLKAWRKRGKHGEFSVASVARARWWEDRLRESGMRGGEERSSSHSRGPRRVACS